MSIANQMTSEINAVLDALMSEGRHLEADRIADTVVAAHDFSVSDQDRNNKLIFEWGLRNTIRASVRSCINRRAGDGDTSESPQLTLPGFAHLRHYYIVPREVKRDDGKTIIVDVGVPISDMTDEEIEAKADLHDQLAAANRAHAKELRRYKRDRRAVMRAPLEISSTGRPA